MILARRGRPVRTVSDRRDEVENENFSGRPREQQHDPDGLRPCGRSRENNVTRRRLGFPPSRRRTRIG